MKKFITVILLCSVVFALCWVGSAYWSIYQIKQAIEQNDEQKIARYIDFPRVQKSLKIQLEKKFAQDMGLNNLNHHSEILGKKLNKVISAQLIETVVTPATIGLLLQGKALYQSDLVNKYQKDIGLFSLEKQSRTNTSSQKVTSTEVNKENTVHGNFFSWNQFAVMIDVNQTHSINVLLEPQWLKWKIIDIQL
ncbi:hypothetical protein B9T31_04345 [Acinetobacter sp. ANC 4558]|uniref:DUF2939 domain-containing protein n=1 Tax=Acinetobacter sp. ANC 4558 TaxID=1977876 RepID=UPI000A3347E6|nr:DUF2939 domain-containing protein [Acinetobacter sp. ANC 4558]OTG87727.1 hypothetical protein B9T31_04345 [Acinetobacter sp. ANC 4558]